MKKLIFYLNFCLVYISITLIYIYQKGISPFIPASCIYFPSCSSYTKQALKEFGFIRGSFLGILRILRCHPGETGGYDPVPKKK